MKDGKSDNLPQWCDLTCPQAELPREREVDGAGSCRTFSALFCRTLRRYVFKNAPCPARKKGKN